MSDAPPSDPPKKQHDPAEVIEVASELMEADREKQERVDLRAIGEEVGVPAPYVDKAVAELDRRQVEKAARAKRTRLRALVILVGVTFAGGVAWLSLRPSKAVDPTASRAPSSRTSSARASASAPAPPSASAAMVKKPFPPTPAVKGRVVAFDLGRGEGWNSGATALEAQGATVREIDKPLSDATLSGVDALILIHARRKPFAADEVLAVERFVRGGKGLVVADIGWTWIHYDKKPITTFPVNAVGEKLGFRFTGDNIGRPARIDDKTIGTVDDLLYDGWAPTRLELEGEKARALVRDDSLHPMAAAIDVDRGHVVVFGHPSMILLTPPLFMWSLAHVLPAPSSCASPEKCQDERCRSDIGLARIAAQIELVLGVTPSCAVVGAPYLVSPGANHYYGAALRCTLAPQPKPAQVKTFTAEMTAAGFPAYQTRSESGNVVVVGSTTTRPCNTY